MKASTLRSFGKPEVFGYEDVAVPEVGSGEVLIKVAGCGINRYDLYMRAGSLFTDIEFPHVLGADVAGTIAEVGPNVSRFQEGDSVIGAPATPSTAPIGMPARKTKRPASR